jgi:hypothetical protein
MAAVVVAVVVVVAIEEVVCTIAVAVVVAIVGRPRDSLNSVLDLRIAGGAAEVVVREGVGSSHSFTTPCSHNLR